MGEGVTASEKYLPGRYPLIHHAGTTSRLAATGHDIDFEELTTSFPSDIRWMGADVDRQYPRASEIVRQALHEIITPHFILSEWGELVPTYLSAREAAQRLQAGLGEWYTPAQVCK